MTSERSTQSHFLFDFSEVDLPLVDKEERPSSSHPYLRMTIDKASHLVIAFSLQLDDEGQYSALEDKRDT